MSRSRFLGFILVLLLQACGEPKEPVSHIPDVIVGAEDALLQYIAPAMLYDGLPFSGTVVLSDDSGRVAERKQYLKGLLHGVHEGFYPSGQHSFRRPYVAGEKHGAHQGWYADGQLRFAYYFEHGLSEGHHQEWYPDGSIYRDMHYENGRERGAQKMYRPDGKLRSNYVVKSNGRRYGLVGSKRCKNIDTENERIKELKPEDAAL